MRKALLVLLISYLVAPWLQAIAVQNLAVSIIAPKDGSYIFPDFELRWSISGVANRTEIYVNDQVVKVDLNPSVGSYYLTNLANGSCRIRVRAVGANNQSAEDAIFVTVLTAQTNIAISSPESGLVTNRTFVIVTWNATGPIGTLRFSSTESDEDVMLDKGQRSYRLTLGTEGEVDVRLDALDLRGTTYTNTISFIHDSYPPSCEVITPADGQAIQQSIVIAQWNCSDQVSQVRKTQIYLDGTMVSNLTRGERLLTDLSDGEHTLRVVAFDEAGNRGEASVRFTISVPFLSRYGLLVDLTIVVVVALLLFFIREKDGNQENEKIEPYLDTLRHCRHRDLDRRLFWIADMKLVHELRKEVLEKLQFTKPGLSLSWPSS